LLGDVATQEAISHNARRVCNVFSEQKFTFGLKKWSEAVHRRQLCGASRSATGVSAEHCVGMERSEIPAQRFGIIRSLDTSLLKL